MSYKVVILEAAQLELEQVKLSLLAESPQSAIRMDDEFQAITTQLQTFPYAYQATVDPDIRRAFLHTCRYTVYFTVIGSMVEIIAFQPQMLSPDTLRRRGLAG